MRGQSNESIRARSRLSLSQSSSTQSLSSYMSATTRRNRAVCRVPSQQHGEHKRRRPRATTAAESAWARSSHDEHPGAQDAGQGARREHHQRPADGLKVNRRGSAKGAHRCQPRRPRDGVTRGSQQLFAQDTSRFRRGGRGKQQRRVDRREREKKREKERSRKRQRDRVRSATAEKRIHRRCWRTQGRFARKKRRMIVEGGE